MGKQNNNFEYFKPQNGSSLVLSESESDNSDSKTMFKLPKRRVIRSKGSSMGKRKGRLCCQVCCQSIVPVIMSVFIIGTLVSIGCLLLGVSGMRRELELLKIKIKIVQSENHSNLKDSRQLQQKLKNEFISSLKENKDEINKLKLKIKTLNNEVKTLNTSLIQMKAKYQTSKSTSSNSVVEDVKLLKKGMADTGGEMKKLTDDSVEAKKTIKLLTKVVKGIKTQLVKISHSLEDVSRQPVPTEPADTLAPLLASTASPEDSQKSLGRVSKLLKKVLNGYNEIFKNKTKHLDRELAKINSAMQKRNITYKQTIMSIREDIKALQNATEKHEERLEDITERLDTAKPSSSNSTSNSKLLGIVKDILVGLKKHQTLISNLTSRIEKMDANKKTTILATTAAPKAASSVANNELKNFEPTSKAVVTKDVVNQPVTARATSPSNPHKNDTDKAVLTTKATIRTNNPPSEGNGTSVSSTDAPAVPREITSAQTKTEPHTSNVNKSLISANPVVVVHSTAASNEERRNKTDVEPAEAANGTTIPVAEQNTHGSIVDDEDEDSTKAPATGIPSEVATDEIMLSKDTSGKDDVKASGKATTSKEASDKSTSSQTAPEEGSPGKKATDSKSIHNLKTSDLERPLPKSVQDTESRSEGFSGLHKKRGGFKPKKSKNSRRKPFGNDEERFRERFSDERPGESDESLDNLDEREAESDDPGFR